MSAQHTPGQLHVAYLSNAWEIREANGSLLTHIPAGEQDNEAYANAVHIAHCWNCHDELLEALEVVSRLDYLHEHNAIADKVRAAIAKAKGGAR